MNLLSEVFITFFIIQNLNSGDEKAEKIVENLKKKEIKINIFILELISFLIQVLNL